MPEGISDTEFEGLADTAAAIFGTAADSEEEQPDDAGEEDLEDDDLEDEEDVDPADELDTDDSEDEDVEEDEDSEDDSDEEDDEEDEDSDEEEDDEEDEEEEDEDDPLHTVKVQGEEFKVPTSELIAGYQRQQDYTLKTQQVSDIYQRMSQWYEQRANDPEFWIEEIATSHDDPSAVIAGAIRRTGDATVLLTQTLKHLVTGGDIEDEVVEALNLQKVAEEAKGQELHHKVQSLEKQLQQRDQTAQERAQQAAVEAELNSQWVSLGLSYDSPAEEAQAKNELLQFAYNKGIPNLRDAYVLMSYQQGEQKAERKPKPQKRKQASSAVKKAKTAAMSRKPTGGTGRQSGGKGSSQKTSQDPNPVATAAAAALAELGLE